MNKNIIIGIVAVVLVIAALWMSGIFTKISSPIDSSDFSGSWEQKLVVTYFDGTTTVLGNAGTATLYHDGASIESLECFLYINPTNIDGNYDTLTLNFDHDSGDFSQKYNIISPTGVYEIEGADAGMVHEGTSLESAGYIEFEIDSAPQLVGVTLYPMSVIDEFILAEEGGYIMEVYYTGSAGYTLDGGTPGSVPAPDGVITIDFSRALTAGIINFGWSSSYEVT